MVSCSFHSPPGVLFTFPSRYCFTIGHSGIFSLTRWSSQIHTGFHVPHATRDIKIFSYYNYWTFTIYGAGFSCFVLIEFFEFLIPTTPICINWFRLFPSRSPLLRESRLLSFPPATKMFQFTGLLLTYL